MISIWSLYDLKGYIIYLREYSYDLYDLQAGIWL